MLRHSLCLGGLLLAVLVLAPWPVDIGQEASLNAAQARGEIPQYRVDAMWPKPLPDNWILGGVSGVTVDAQDHVWIIHRPRTLIDRDGPPPTSVCCKPAPNVIEFDPQGNVVQAWGGDGPGYKWGSSEHGISVDPQGNVWVTDETDDIVLKFSRQGKFLLQLGMFGVQKGNNDVETLGGPCQAHVDGAANEVFIGDCHGNRRMIVFDAMTGMYKRRWNAYGGMTTEGRAPAYDPNGPPSKDFLSPHCLRLSSDGLVYVCDRGNNRIQVFRKDGTFVEEVVVDKPAVPIGVPWDMAFTPDERFILVADGANQKIWIVERKPLRVVGSFGRGGRNAGQFLWINALETDSRGNLYTGEVTKGDRVQKFVPVNAAARGQRR